MAGSGGDDVGSVTQRDVVVRVPARVGLVGNPSDGYGGAVLATPVHAMGATVSASPSAGVGFIGAADRLVWPSPDAWLAHVAATGHGDEQRIVSASLWTLVDHLRSVDRLTPPGSRPSGSGLRGVTLRWHTDVPRSVGLAGSSAIAVAVIRAAAGVWEVPLDARVVAALALRAEREVLGIAAGWQDRIVQSFACTVLVDASTIEVLDGCDVPVVRTPTLGPATAASLVIGWVGSGSESSDSYHAPLRRAAAALAAPMAALAGSARTAADAWELGDVERVAAAMDEGWRTRQACAPLRPDHAALVETVRRTGVAATTPGSGGSVVAMCLDPHAVERACAALTTVGASFVVQPVS